jgi:hypothetical protein
VPSIVSVTPLAPLDVHFSSIIVGAEHDTGPAGKLRSPATDTLPPVAGTLVVLGAAVDVVEPEPVVGGAFVDAGVLVPGLVVVVDATVVDPGVAERWPWLHAPSASAQPATSSAVARRPTRQDMREG